MTSSCSFAVRSLLSWARRRFLDNYGECAGVEESTGVETAGGAGGAETAEGVLKEAEGGGGGR